MVTKIKIPGVTFSWKRTLGITRMKQQIAKTLGIPTTKQGMERKIGKVVLGMFSKK